MGWLQEALDRGVTVKRVQHVVGKDDRGRTLTTPGPYVYMYKGEPGVYYDERGNIVSEGLAKAVGYETSKLAVEKRKRERIAEVTKRIEDEVRAAEDAPFEEKTYLAERGDWRVLSLPGDKARVEDHQGNVISGVMSKADALDLLDLTFPPEEVKIPDVTKDNPQKGTTNGRTSS